MTNFPKITFPQIIGGTLGAAGPVLVLLGVHLDPSQLQAVDDLQVLAVGLFGADAIVRVGRNINQAMSPPLSLKDVPTTRKRNPIMQPDTTPNPQSPSPDKEALNRARQEGYEEGVRAATADQPTPSEPSADSARPVPNESVTGQTVRDPDADNPRPDEPHRA